MTNPVTSHTTAPHLAKRDLVYLTPDRLDDFFAAVLRGFHDDYVAAKGKPYRKVVEPDRTFGFQVDGRWISTCGGYSRMLTVPGGTVPAAAVTLVTVHASYRRRGLLTEMMKHQLDDIHQRGKEPVALLWASESSIYGRYGYGQAGPQVRLSGKTKTTAFRPDVDLGEGSVGEVERDQAIPIIKGTIPNSRGTAHRRIDLRSITTAAAIRTATWCFESRTTGRNQAPRSGSRNLMPKARQHVRHYGGSFLILTWYGDSSGKMRPWTTRCAIWSPTFDLSRLRIKMGRTPGWWMYRVLSRHGGTSLILM